MCVLKTVGSRACTQDVTQAEHGIRCDRLTSMPLWFIELKKIYGSAVPHGHPEKLPEIELL